LGLKVRTVVSLHLWDLFRARALGEPGSEGVRHTGRLAASRRARHRGHADAHGRQVRIPADDGDGKAKQARRPAGAGLVTRGDRRPGGRARQGAASRRRRATGGGPRASEPRAAGQEPASHGRRAAGQEPASHGQRAAGQERRAGQAGRAPGPRTAWVSGRIPQVRTTRVGVLSSGPDGGKCLIALCEARRRIRSRDGLSGSAGRPAPARPGGRALGWPGSCGGARRGGDELPSVAGSGHGCGRVAGRRPGLPR